MTGNNLDDEASVRGLVTEMQSADPKRALPRPPNAVCLLPKIDQSEDQQSTRRISPSQPVARYKQRSEQGMCITLSCRPEKWACKHVGCSIKSQRLISNEGEEKRTDPLL